MRHVTLGTPLALALCGLLLSSPAAASGYGGHPNLAPPGECAVPDAPGAGRGLPPVAAAPPAEAGAVGWVASLFGNAEARRPGSAPRALACGDSLFPGERVVTGPASSAGLLVGEVLAQLGADSAAQLGLGPDAQADISLERGGVRMIDPRSSGPPARLAALGAEAGVVGNDVQARVGDGGGSATLCGLGGPLQVQLGVQSLAVAAGACARIAPGQPLTADAAAGDPIAALDATCEEEPPFSLLAHLDELPPVAAPYDGPPLPDGPEGPPRSPCDVPGSGCGGGITVSEQGTTDTPFPGGQGGFPGTGAP